MFRRVARAITPKKWHLTGRLQSDIVRRANGRVVTGMFAGMQYVEQSSGSVWLPKLLGTYEQELAPHLEPLLGQNFDVIVVAGAAEGYYAVGFALKSNAQKIVAFEPNPHARQLLSALALRNGVGKQVIVKGICDLSGLKAVLDASSKVLSIIDLPPQNEVFAETFAADGKIARLGPARNQEFTVMLKLPVLDAARTIRLSGPARTLDEDDPRRQGRAADEMVMLGSAAYPSPPAGQQR